MPEMEDSVHTNRSETDHVNVGRSALRNLTAASATVDRSAVQRLTAETVVASNSAVGLARAATFEMKDSSAAITTGDYVRVENSRIFLLLAPRVNGTVHAVLTLPAAFALGAGYFVARRLFKAAFGRS